jgi:DUF177 domain-containing protein
LFIEVNKIPPEGLEVDQLLALPPILQSNGELAPLEGVKLAGALHRLDSDIEFRGQVEGVVSLICSRCLVPFKLKLGGACHRIFRPGALGRPESEHALVEEDLALTPFDGVRIDLTEMAREQMYLAVPLKPLCRETCRGICPRCGADRNSASCNCPEETSDLSPLTSKLTLQ